MLKNILNKKKSHFVPKSEDKTERKSSIKRDFK